MYGTWADRYRYKRTKVKMPKDGLLCEGVIRSIYIYLDTLLFPASGDVLLRVAARSSCTIVSGLVPPACNKNGVEGGTFFRGRASLVPLCFCPPQLGKTTISDRVSQRWIKIERVNGGGNSWRRKAPNRTLWNYKLCIVILSICDDGLYLRPRHVNVEIRLCV